MKNNRIQRVLGILFAIHSGLHWKINSLAETFGVSRRTLYRDLKELQKAGVPIYYDKKHHCYEINPAFSFSLPYLQPKEALGLLLLACLAKLHYGMPFADCALKAVLKIQSNLPTQIKRYCAAMLHNITIENQHEPRSHLYDKVFAQLQKAILKRQIVNIRYYLPHQQKTIETDLKPYHLMYKDSIWYVLGKSVFFKTVHPFRLDQIEKLNILNRCFIEEADFDLSEYLGRAWSVDREGRLYNIKLRFLPDIARDVAQVQWHSTQTVTFEADGSAIFEFRVDGLNEITWWILGYGDKVQVLAPKILRQKILGIARNMVRTCTKDAKLTYA